MKLIFLISVLLLVASFNQVSDSWVISRGKKTLLKGKEGDPIKTIAISLTDTSALLVQYKEAPSNIKWKRDFILKNSQDSLLLSIPFNYSSGKFSLPYSSISPLLQKYAFISIVTEQHPLSDDMMIRSKKLTLAIIQKK
jgi:hypothetical protein